MTHLSWWKILFSISPSNGRHGKELQVDGAAMAVVVADVGDVRADFGADAEFFLEFARERLLGAFAVFDLAAGKLPLQGHGLVGSSLANQDQAITNQKARHHKTERGTRGRGLEDDCGSSTTLV